MLILRTTYLPHFLIILSWRVKCLKKNTRSTQPRRNCSYIPRYASDRMQKCYRLRGVKIWIDIPADIQNSSYNSFKIRFKKRLLQTYNWTFTGVKSWSSFHANHWFILKNWISTLINLYLKAITHPFKEWTIGWQLTRWPKDLFAVYLRLCVFFFLKLYLFLCYFTANKCWWRW